jgi:hypothetical protein
MEKGRTKTTLRERDRKNNSRNVKKQTEIENVASKK